MARGAHARPRDSSRQGKGEDAGTPPNRANGSPRPGARRSEPNLSPDPYDSIENDRAPEPRPGQGNAPAAERGGLQLSARRKAQRKPSLLRELPILVGIAIVLALVIKTFLVQAFFIPSDSMENTLLKGDRVLVNKLGARVGEPGRGEIVVFHDPGGWLNNGKVSQGKNPLIRGIKNTLVFVGLLPSDLEQDLIKRVIGLPGDRVVCCDEQGRITVNGVVLNEPYLYPGNPPSDSPFDVTVPPGRLWVMGDHRSVSADSRSHLGEVGQGTIPTENVVGRAFSIVWPIGRVGGLAVPNAFQNDQLGLVPTASLSDPAALAASVPPLFWGLAGALPLVAVRRRRRGRRLSGRAE